MNTTQKLEKMLADTDNELTKYVIQDILDAEPTEEAENYMRDIMRAGCVSGAVSGLIYYYDTKAFYIKYMDEIDELFHEYCDSTGEQFELESPIYNCLAWFAYEQTVSNIINELELEH